MLVIALGDKGTGKSRAIRTLVAARLASSTLCSAVVHDPNEQWSGGAVFGTVAEVRAHIRAKGSIPRLVLVRRDTPHRVCRLAWDIGDTTCVVDELDTVCTAKAWSKKEEIPEFECGAARALAHYGRHRNVDLLGSFRFTRNVNEDIPGLADFVVLMRHSEGGLFDVRLLAQRFGEAYAEQVTQLDDHECIVWSKQ